MADSGLVPYQRHPFLPLQLMPPAPVEKPAEPRPAPAPTRRRHRTPQRAPVVKPALSGD